MMLQPEVRTSVRFISQDALASADGSHVEPVRFIRRYLAPGPDDVDVVVSWVRDSDPDINGAVWKF